MRTKYLYENHILEDFQAHYGCRRTRVEGRREKWEEGKTMLDGASVLSPRRATMPSCEEEERRSGRAETRRQQYRCTTETERRAKGANVTLREDRILKISPKLFRHT